MEKTMQNSILAINNQRVAFELRDNQAFCTSLDIAKVFEKRHDNILRDIRAILDIENDEIFTDLKIEGSKNQKEIKEFNALNFELSEYKDSTGRVLPCYNLNRDGFSLLAMGFTGVKAHLWKIAFINSFNQMEQLIQEMKQNYVKQQKYHQAEQRETQKITQSFNNFFNHIYKGKSPFNFISENE